MDVSEVISKLTEYFKDKPAFDTVLLFGSYAAGTWNAFSDADIAVHADYPLSDDLAADIQLDLTLLLHKEVDFVDLRQSDGVFLHEIMTKNIRIKCDNDVYQHYLMKSLLFMQYDYPVIKRLQEEKIRRFLNEYRDHQQ